MVRYSLLLIITCSIIILAGGAWAQEKADTITPKTKRAIHAFIGISPVPLELTLSVGDDGGWITSATATLFDSDNKPVDNRTTSIFVIPNTDYPLYFALTPPDYGYYTALVEAKTTDGQTAASYRTSFGILRPLTIRQTAQDPLKSIFGVNFHYDQGQGDLEIIPQLMQMAGLKWIRDSIDWRPVEPAKGHYDIKPYLRSAYPLLLKRYGIRTLGILCYDNPGLYQHAAEEEAQAFGKYAEYLAKEFTGVVDHFEVWNEPEHFSRLTPEQYVPVLKSAYEGIKRGNPNAFVIGIGGASPGGWSGHYIPEIRNQNAAGYMDAFSIHPYTAPKTCDVGYRTEGAPAPLANLESARALTMNFAEDIRKAKGLKKAPGIWITELGWPTNVNGLMGQAQQTARAYIMAAAMPDVYERVFIYDFLCDGEKPRESEHNFGFVNYDYSIRPSYLALAAVSRAIEGRPFIRRIPHPDDSVRLYLFGPKNDPVVIGWVTEVSPTEMINGKLKSGKSLKRLPEAGSWLDRKYKVLLQTGSSEVTIRDWQDRERVQSTRDGMLSIDLSTWPVYIYKAGSESGIAVK